MMKVFFAPTTARIRSHSMYNNPTPTTQDIKHILSIDYNDIYRIYVCRDI